ncbi:MAG: hypothetical protein AB1554_09405 [Chloroflexota bacterium]
MKFSYRQTAKDAESFFHDALFVEGNGAVVLALRVDENTIEGWLAGLKKLQQASHPYLQNLLDKASELKNCNYDDLPTLWRIIFALRALNCDKASAEPLTACLQKWFSFEARCAADAYQYLVCAGGEMVLLRQHSLAKVHAVPRSVPVYVFSADIAELQTESPAKFQVLLQNYERLLEASTHYQEDMDLEKKGFVQHSFANFSKALIEFLDKDETVHVPIRTMNTILGVAIKDENVRLSDQQSYLGRVLESRENERGKYQRCKDIVQDVRGDVREKRCEASRLISIIGAISAYYLRRYDFERAIEFWNLLDEKDRLLRQILKLYGRTWKYVVTMIVGMVAAVAAIWLNTANTFSPAVKIFLSNFPLVVLLPPLAAIPFFAIYIFIRFIVVRKGPEYIEMFFPRLLGAIVVGLSVLLFQDTSWNFGMKLSAANLALIGMVVYPMALLYIFINVHKELRYLTYDAGADSNKGKQNLMMKHSIRVSLKIFSIGLLESFVAVLVTSSLLYQGVLLDDYSKLRCFSQCSLTATWNIGSISIGFFPAIIFLWTGLSLLIGAFAQLLWQDKNLTSA